jgi:hypothetical protein
MDCSRCGHPFDPHELRSTRTAPEFGIDAPVAGWIVCPEEGCDCWSTWAISHEDLPPGLVALIEQELTRVRAAHAARAL